MSETIKRFVPCPKCYQQSETEIICNMNTEKEPHARDSIFDDSLFKWQCPKCGTKKKLLHPFLYNDLKHKFMIYYIPKTERDRLADEKIEQEFSELTYIKKRVVSDVNSIKEKIVLFEAGLNDMAVELTKYAVREVVKKSTGLNVSSGYFTDTDLMKNSMSFQFFVGPEHRPYLQTTRLEVYNRSLDIIKKNFPNEDKRKGFLNIDRNWAKNTMQKYKNMK